MGRFLAIVIALVVVALAINYMQKNKPVGNDGPKLVEPVQQNAKAPDTTTETAPADAAPVDTAPVDTAPAEEAPADAATESAAESPAADASVGETAVAEVPAAEVADETSAEATPSTETALDVALSLETPADPAAAAAVETPAAAAPAEAAPAAETPATVAPAEVESSAAVSTAEAAEPSAPAPEEEAAPAGPTAAAVQAREARDEAVAAADKAIQEVVEAEPVDEMLKGIAVADPTQEEQVLLGGNELLMGIPGAGDLTAEQIEQWLTDPKNRVVLQPELPLGLAAGAGQIQGIDANPLTRAKIELGRQLYFDTRLSGDNTISCASCHDPAFGYAKDTQFGVGIGSQTGNRNSPTAYNRILSGPQFWDGRATSLEDQAIGPIANPVEMGSTHEVCVQSVAEIPGYRIQFDAIFPDGLSIENIGKAIAAFERTIVTGPAPWDYYQQLVTFEKAYAADIEDLELLKEEDEELYNEYMELKQASEEHPISESAIRGGELFFSDKAACTTCHVGANFTDELYHNLGVGMEAAVPDLGRFEQTGEDKDQGAFKTPTVRNVALTAPYMHDGTQQTLEEVVEWYAKGGHPNPYLSDKIKKLDLTEQDKADLVAFMKEGLTSSLPQPEQGRLPK